MTTKVCLIGYGRMGKAIESILPQNDCEVGHIINRSSDWSNYNNKSCDVAIDFSLPSSAFDNISHCIKIGLPIVSGTTGWLDKMDQINILLEKNKESAFLYGSNFSLGMNLFFRMNSYTASLMKADPSYSIEMLEIHHVKKLDQPSGTAISLANDIIEVRDDKDSWINKSVNETNRIGIKSERTPDVPGTHIVTYENEIDKIEISHEAKSRMGFAVGAVKAAKWLVDKKGSFTISDYIDYILRTQI